MLRVDSFPQSGQNGRERARKSQKDTYKGRKEEHEGSADPAVAHLTT